MNNAPAFQHAQTKWFTEPVFLPGAKLQQTMRNVRLAPKHVL